jgi:hypothetical protein
MEQREIQEIFRLSEPLGFRILASELLFKKLIAPIGYKKLP